ncbi:MAG: hypothetical protein R3E12_04060 [Candidatus Eisenbacteria bacterium]|uniref:Glycosyltransferase RgtA/B/C/D-like domain-containing protein n=1 Tax=Eiseniibacteriota bacterium TaxID=2212470 RepID=A0A956LZL0_UNCEI|nr:hypothetical protein [Candidatus Eisenbacteria bacterium]
MADRSFSAAVSRTEVVALLAILVAAAVLRTIGLGHLGYWIDEDLTWLAVRGIHEDGVPLLPSGVIYARGLPYSYLTAFTTSLLGTTPAMLRLPSLVCSLGTLVFVVLLVRELMLAVAHELMVAGVREPVLSVVREPAGRRATFLAAVLMLASPWELHYAQMARMYALFAMLVAATLFFAVRSLRTGGKAAWIAACLCVLIAVPTHQLGSTLILVFLVPALCPRGAGFGTSARRPSLTWIAGGFGAVVLGMLWQRFATDLPGMQSRVDLDLIVDAGGHSAGISLPFLPEITLNHAAWIALDAARTSWAAGGAVLVGIAAAVLGLVSFLRGRMRDESGAWVIWIAAAAFVGCLAVNQLVLAGLCGLLLLKLLGPQALPLRRSIPPLVLAGVAVVSALLLAQAIAHGAEGVTDRKFLRLFFAIPVPFYRLLITQHPITVLVILGGAAILFPRSLRRGADQQYFVVLGFFVGSLLLMGLFRSPYVIHRYTYYLNPALIALFAVSAVVLADIIASRWPQPHHRSAVAWVLAIGLLGACEQFDPLQCWAAAHRGYGYERATLSDPDLTSHFHYDYESCARFVLTDRGPGDVAIAKEPVELYPYGLHCDARVNEIYGVYAKTLLGDPVDWYLGIPILSSADELREWIGSARQAGHTVYVIYTKPSPAGPAIHLPPDVLELLASYDDQIVHTAGDGLTVVVRLR